MIAAEIAAALGGAHRSGAWLRCRCPVHESRGAALVLRDGERGLIVKCWAGCDPRDVLSELRRRGMIGRGDDRRPDSVTVRRVDHDDASSRRIEAAQRIWDRARDARGTPVSAYLAGRGITIGSPASLRWAPSLRRPNGIRGPAMVARIDDIDGVLIGVSRSWLDRDAAGTWRRRDRAMLGRAAGGAVRLAAAAETLMVGEGVETCLAAMQATSMPAWAALSTSGMVGLILPPMVRTVIILGDNDVNRAGERAAHTAARRWLAEGRRVRIAMPRVPGTDFNNVLMGRGYAEVCDVAA